MQQPLKKYLTRSEAAQYLTERGARTAKGTLQKLASVGGGPVYRVFGRNALYRPEDLDAWVDSKPDQQSARQRGAV